MPGIILYLILAVLKYISAEAPCPTTCVCENVAIDVKCEESGMKGLPNNLNPGLEHLIVRNNEWRTIEKSIHFYPKLKYIDFSHNKIARINDRIFVEQNILQQLILSNNNLRVITNQSFFGLQKLSVLNMRRNLIENLNDYIFTTTSELEELNLEDNRINQISQNAFSGLRNLRVLYLDNNLLNGVPSAAFKLMNVLAELYLGMNTLINLADQDFAHLTELTQLDLSSSLIISIANGTFHNLTQLRRLNLCDNKLESLPSGQMSVMTRLEELNLGGNEFETIGKNTFSNLHYLRILNISDCPKLRSLENDAFISNVNLEVLIIENNPELFIIGQWTFKNTLHIRKVYLRNNNIKNVHYMWFKWDDLEEFAISGNSFDCECLRGSATTAAVTMPSAAIASGSSQDAFKEDGFPLSVCIESCFPIWKCEIELDPANNNVKTIIFFIILTLIVIVVFVTLIYFSIRKMSLCIRNRIYMKNCFHIDNDAEDLNEQDNDNNRHKQQQQGQPSYPNYDSNLIEDNFHTIDNDYTHFLNSSQDLIIQNSNYNNKPLPIITEL